MADTTKKIFTEDGQKLQKVHDNGDGTVAPAVYVMNPGAGGGGGGGGGATTIADGADAALGATTNAEAAAGNGTVIAILKRVRTLLDTVITKFGGGLPAALDADGGLKTHIQNLPATQNVAVQNFPATQPVNGTVNVGNLPAEQAVTAADGAIAALGQRADVEATGNGSLIAITKRLRTLLGSILTTQTDGTQKTQVTNFPATQPVSSAQLPGALDADGGMKVHLQNPTSASVTVADGADAALGATTDAEAAAGNGTVVALLKRVRTLLDSQITKMGGGLPAALGAAGGLKTEVQNWPATQPVSSTQLPVALDADGGVKTHVQNLPATQAISAADGSNAALGATTDAEAAGNGSLIAITKRARTLLGNIITLLAVLTDGTMRSRITDGADNVGISTVGAAKALKVDVVQTVGGGGGGGSAVTAADGALATIGTTTDAEVAAGDGTVIALLKRARTLLGSITTLLGGGLPAALTSGALKVASYGKATTAGDTPILTTASGSQYVTLRDTSSATPAIQQILGASNMPVTGLMVGAYQGLLDDTGAGYHVRANCATTLYSSVFRSAAPASTAFQPYSSRGIKISIRLTVGPNNGSTLRIAVYDRHVPNAIDSVDPLAFIDIPSGDYSVNKVFVLTIYPGASGPPENTTYNKTYALCITPTMKIDVTHNGAGGWTYGIAVVYLM
jgi:hypothetical protein